MQKSGKRHAFLRSDRCPALQSITLPDSLKTIASGAFGSCGLKKITVPASVTTIDSLAFDGCKRLASIDVASDSSTFAAVDGVLYSADKTTLIWYPAGKTDTAYQMPDTVTTVAYAAGADNGYLEELTLSKALTTVEETAFKNCAKLASITVPEGVKRLGKEMFLGCDRLAEITLPASLTDIAPKALNCARLRTVKMLCVKPTVVTTAIATTVPLTVCYAGTQANWASIPVYVADPTAPVTGKALPDYLNPQTIYYCYSTDFVINNDTLSQYNGKGGSVVIPDGVTAIGYGVFYDCTALTSVTVPASVTEIGNYAFTGCTHLTAIVFGGSEAQWANLAANTGIGDNVTVICNAKATDPVAISGQPADVSGKVNDAVTFTVKATGSGLTYQWYYKKAGESDFIAWNKKTAASVSTPIYASWHNAQFYCIVKDGSGKTVKSSTVTLTVTPKITQQPASVSGAVNGTATFSIKASGIGLTYQWYYRKSGASDWTKWNGKTGTSASLTIYKSWNNAQFYCEAKDSSGKTVKSDTAILTVK